MSGGRSKEVKRWFSDLLCQPQTCDSFNRWMRNLCMGCVCLLLFSPSVVSDSVTRWSAARQAFLSFTISQSSLKLMPIEPMMSSNHFTLCCPILLPSIFPSIKDFSNELAFCIRWPKCWSFSFSIGAAHEYSGLISFRMDRAWRTLLCHGVTVALICQRQQAESSAKKSPTGNNQTWLGTATPQGNASRGFPTERGPPSQGWELAAPSLFWI